MRTPSAGIQTAECRLERPYRPIERGATPGALRKSNCRFYRGHQRGSSRASACFLSREADGATSESVYRAATKTKTGSWRDLAVLPRARPRSARPLAKARAFGLAMPLTERLIAMIEELETGRRQMACANLDELVAVSSPAR